MKIGKEKTKKAISTVFMLIIGLVFFLPVIWTFMNSIKESSAISEEFLALPTTLYLDNFVEAIDRMHFFTALKNSLIIAICATVCAVFVSFLAAYGIAHLKGKLGNGFYLYFVFGQLIPFHVVMVCISVMATKVHLTNSLAGIVLLDTGFFSAFGVLTFVGFLKSVPFELEEAGMIDGCGPIRSMLNIVFPLVKPATVTLGVLFFLWSWNDFLLPSILISETELRPLTVNLYMFKGATSTEWNLFIAGLTMCIIPTIVLYIAAQKYITSGLTLGALK